MRHGLRGAAAVLLAVLIASCTAKQAAGPLPAPAAVPAPVPGATCRVGPDGGPLLAERGIGGTGAPGPGPTEVADRGIGGTGIIGVITGFGSVCVGGAEVALGAAVPVTVDDAAADPSVLRAGQLVALEAGGTDGALAARSVRVRHEVSGPVELATPGLLRVAGQDVAVTADTWLSEPLPGPGDWVAVSGLRRPDGVIEATRIDPRPPGPVLVHGTLTQRGGQLHLGHLALAAGPDAARLLGTDVTATGVLLGAELQVATLEPDRLVADPGGYFSVGVTGLLVEGFLTVDAGEARLGRIALPAGRAFAGLPGRAVVSFSRTAAGRFEAVGLAARAPGPDGPGRAFTPAPGARGTGGGFGGAFGNDRAGGGRGSRGTAGVGPGRYGPDPGGPARPAFGPDGSGGGPDGGGFDPSGRRRIPR